MFFAVGYVAGGNYTNHTAVMQSDSSLTDFTCVNDSLTNCSYNVVDNCSNYNTDVVIACSYG